MQDKYNIVRLNSLSLTPYSSFKNKTLFQQSHICKEQHTPGKILSFPAKCRNVPYGIVGDSRLKFPGFFPLGLKELHASPPHFPVWCSPEMKTQAGVGVGTRVGERVCPLPCLLVPPLSRV